eukprot:5015060-Pleurochrysis_carterae.AAC.5
MAPSRLPILLATIAAAAGYLDDGGEESRFMLVNMLDKLPIMTSPYVSAPSAGKDMADARHAKRTCMLLLDVPSCSRCAPLQTSSQLTQMH